jgi:DNA-binding response OmpR family regulator
MHELNNMSGLIVEDVPAMRTYLRMLLTDKHIEVTEAANLEEARCFLRTTSNSKLDFVILDLELPDGNGLDLIPEMSATTRVIALTGDGRRESQLQCHKAGCDLMIDKSLDLTKLKQIITNNRDTDSATSRRNLDNCFPYVEYLAETRVALQNAMKRSDFLVARRIAHRIRGTAVHFGYPGIGTAAKSVSTAMATGRFDQFNATIDALTARISEAIESHQLNTLTTQPAGHLSCDA